MSVQLRIIVSQLDDIYHNLALEEWLWHNLADNELIFLLYCNQDSVVMGRNQNPWLECPIGKLYRNQIKLARRSTGGGTVFHDKGNLNFSFILPLQYHCVNSQVSILQRALRTIDIHAECDTQFYHLWVNGYKISGQAFLYRMRKVIHHGTLLVDSNLKKLSECVTGADASTFTTNAVASKIARVMNLTDLHPHLSMDKVQCCLKSAVNDYWMEQGFPKPIEEIIQMDSETNQIRIRKKDDMSTLSIGQYKDWYEIYQRHFGWNWIFAKTPPFQLTYPIILNKQHQFLLYLDVQGGYIQTLSVRFDFSLMNKNQFKLPDVNELASSINEVLPQIQFNNEQVICAINQLESKFKMMTSSN